MGAREEVRERFWLAVAWCFAQMPCLPLPDEESAAASAALMLAVRAVSAPAIWAMLTVEELCGGTVIV